MKASRQPRGRSRPANDPAFDPIGGEEGLREAFASLLKFGPLNADATVLAKGEIVDLAKGYNRVSASRAPARSDVIKQLSAVEKSAKRLSEALETLNDVSLGWLVGDVHLSGVAVLPAHLPSYRYVPAAKGDRSYISPLLGPGPGDLLDDPTFDRALKEAFGLQWVSLKSELPARRERAVEERRLLDARRKAAKRRNRIKRRRRRLARCAAGVRSASGSDQASG